ncbi:MAG: glycyl radical protein [Candidatus Saliniplasma sp.]
MDNIMSCSLGREEEIEARRSSIKPINERIKRLREESVEGAVTVSSERAELITDFYKNVDLKDHSVPVQRALAFKHLMENVSIPVEKGQLIVGIRGTGVKEVPTYPEVCCHKKEDLDVLDSRENNPYKVDKNTEESYAKEIIPFWEGKTIREKIFDRMSEEWKDAYEAGVFTEFMEQRVPGHTSGGEKIFSTGLLEIKKEIQEKKSDEQLKSRKLEELKAMEITIDGMISYAERYADKLEMMSAKHEDKTRKEELKYMSKICRKVPKHPPDTYWEALQHYWFIHVGITTESNPWDSFNPGRLDQHLYPFYQDGIENGVLDKRRAKELLEAFWLKFNNQPAPPKVGVTAQESNTYNDFSKINIGGVDKDGFNGVNEISYLLLETLEDMRTLQPNTAVLISKKAPDKFLNKALEVVKPGFGEPPFFNHDEIIKILLRQGKELKDARTGGVSGCIETGAFGKESYILTGYFNLPKVLEITLHNGIDPMSGKKIGSKTGEVKNFDTFSELFQAFKEQLRYFIDVKEKGNDTIEKIYHEELPVPFLSLWIEDCVEEGTDYNSGGARYNTQYIQMVGLGTIVDSLSSVKFNIFNKNRYDFEKVMTALEENFETEERMRQVFINKTPKYGNDNDYADDIAKKLFDTCIDIVESYPPSPIRKASRRVYGLPTTVHVYFGSMCKATPDGRKSGEPLSEGISPVQGADRKGIGAVFRSVGKLDHVKSGGTLLNQKLSPDLINDEEVRKKLGALMRGYFKMDSHHVQYNVVSTELLREAQENPDEFRDLMVRVAGYSDYFVNLPKGLQEEIIERTEQNG